MSVCTIGPEWDDPALLVPSEERMLLAGMVAVRRREFIAGRVQARALMERMGHAPVAILPGVGRQPIWPDRLIGSITHSRQLCAVALGPRVHAAAIGIDIEAFGPIETNLHDRICNLRERDGFASRRWPISPAELVCCVFSAKEAFYKAWYPLTGRFLEYQDVTVTLLRDLCAFTVEVSAPVAAPFDDLSRLTGEMVIRDGHVATSFVWHNAPVAGAWPLACGIAAS